MFRACVITLLIVYALCLAAGVAFYRYMQKTKPQPCPPGDIRNQYVKQWRFVVHVILLPLAVTLSLGVMGVLDPFFHIVARVMG